MSAGNTAFSGAWDPLSTTHPRGCTQPPTHPPNHPFNHSRYLDAVDSILTDHLPTLQDATARLSRLPGARRAILDALAALEAGLPAQRVAAVGAALVGGFTSERVRYGGRAADAVLPPQRLEKYAGVIGQVRDLWLWNYG